MLRSLHTGKNVAVVRSGNGISTILVPVPKSLCTSALPPTRSNGRERPYTRACRTKETRTVSVTRLPCMRGTAGSLAATGAGPRCACMCNCVLWLTLPWPEKQSSTPRGAGAQTRARTPVSTGTASLPSGLAKTGRVLTRWRGARGFAAGRMPGPATKGALVLCFQLPCLRVCRGAQCLASAQCAPLGYGLIRWLARWPLDADPGQTQADATGPKHARLLGSPLPSFR
jgi:hypothetical protein